MCSFMRSSFFYMMVYGIIPHINKLCVHIDSQGNMFGLLTNISAAKYQLLGKYSHKNSALIVKIIQRTMKTVVGSLFSNICLFVIIFL